MMIKRADVLQFAVDHHFYKVFILVKLHYEKIYFIIWIERIVITTWINLKIMWLIIIMIIRTLFLQRGPRHGYNRHSYKISLMIYTNLTVQQLIMVI